MGHSHNHVPVQDPGSLVVSNRLKTICMILVFLGVSAFVVSVASRNAGGVGRAWHSFLIGYFFTVSLAVGGLFLTAIQHLTSAGWSVNVRRIFESFTSFLPVAFVLGIVMFALGGSHLYEWFVPEEVAKSHLLQHKAPYLNKTFLAIRYIVFFGLWIYFAKALVGRSLLQDQTGDESLTKKMVPYSVAFILTFALSYSFFSVDTLMSLEADWFSTIFGVYAFAGLFQSTIAVTILTIAYLHKKGKLQQFINNNHLHDLGKFLFAFTVFWAYIAFSQFMLIWYANLPEETLFFEPRMHGSWLYVSLALIIFKFIVPFLALLPQWAKRNINHLSAVSILILIMQFVDLYWLVYPNFNHDKVVLGLTEILIFLGFIGLFVFMMVRFLSQNRLVPIKDPRIQESLHHHVVY